MLHNLFQWLVPTAHAQISAFPTSTYGFDSQNYASTAVSYLFGIFWGPFGIISAALILISIAVMVIRRIRGVARHPR